jgi:hypothetical protein
VAHRRAGVGLLTPAVGHLAQPLAGRILIDGTDLRHFELASLRSRVGLVSQEPFNWWCADNVAVWRTFVCKEQFDKKNAHACPVGRNRAMYPGSDGPASARRVLAESHRPMHSLRAAWRAQGVRQRRLQR